MKRIVGLLTAFCLSAVSAWAVSINLTLGILQDENGNPLPDGTTLLLIVSTGDSSFGNLLSSSAASATQFPNEPDDVILKQFTLDSSTFGMDGAHIEVINFNLGDLGIGPGDPMILAWYPGLSGNANTQPGPARRFGTYRGADWVTPGDNGADLNWDFLTESAGGTLVDTEGRADQITEGVPSLGPDLGVTKVDSPNPVVVSNNVTYTITVTNRGPGHATGVVLTDTLPAGSSFVSVSSGCTNIGGTVTCNLGTLSNAASAQITLVVTALQVGALTNTVSVAADEDDANPSDNSATAVTTVIPAPVPTADLRVSKMDNPDPVTVGSNLTYTITVTNAGPDTATGIVLTDTLPASVSFVSSSGGCTNSGQVVTCTLGSLAAGASAQFTIVVTPNALGLITNLVSVSADQVDDNTDNNTASAVTTVNPVPVPTADLGVSKSDSPDPVTVSNNITYTIVVTNAGPDIATGVVLTDTLPASVALVSASSGCVNVGNTVTCNLGTLTNGTSRTVTIVVTALQTGSLTNTVNVAADQADNNTANNTAGTVTTVSAPTGGLQTTFDPRKLRLKCKEKNGVVTCILAATLEVLNTGEEESEGINVSYWLSANPTFEGNPTDTRLTDSKGNFVFPTGPIKAGKARKLKLKNAGVTPDAPGQYLLAVNAATGQLLAVIQIPGGNN